MRMQPAADRSLSSNHPSHPIAILSISSNRHDHIELGRLVSGFPFHVFTASDCESALRRLARTPTAIVVCEAELPDGTWRNVLVHTQKVCERPLLIVSSSRVDDTLWAEVLNLGGFDVLAKPFDEREARHVLQSACLRRTSAPPPARTAAA